MTNATAQTADNAKLIAHMIETNTAAIVKLQDALDREANSNSLVSHSWVVVMPLLGCVKYTLTPIRENGRRRYQASDAMPAGRADTANRYTKEDAKVLAADTVNGSGEYGRAMHWTDRAAEEIAELEKLNETLNNL